MKRLKIQRIFIEIKNFMNVQQNIFNNAENQKLYYYTNTEYDQNILPKNMNLETILFIYECPDSF